MGAVRLLPYARRLTSARYAAGATVPSAARALTAGCGTRPASLFDRPLAAAAASLHTAGTVAAITHAALLSEAPAPSPHSKLFHRSFKTTSTVQAKEKKPKKDKDKKKSSKSSGGASKSPGAIKEGERYQTETRKIVLSLHKADKKSDGGKVILDNVSMGMYLGAKIGVLGSNGSGKSTLLRILAGLDDQFDGTRSIDKGLRVGFLAQEPQLDSGATVDSNIEPAVEATRAMLDRFAAVSREMADPDADYDALMAEMDHLQTQIDNCNGWELDRLKERAMEALRCPPGDARIEHLSGGEKRRVALCRLLLESPDILLLDEPTNHLDAVSVAWLERFLAEFKGTVVAVTHDRYFLDNVAGWILELDRGKGIPYQGNYSEWLRARDQRLEQEQSKQSGLQRAIKAELEWLNKQAKGQQKKGKARQANYKELVAQAASYTKTATVDQIVIPPPAKHLKGDPFVAKDLSKGYGDSLLIEGANFEIPAGSVVGIIGGNGAGKTTLFRMITGEEEPTSGTLTVAEEVKAMYVDQSRDSLDDDNSVYGELSQGGGGDIQLGDRTINARAYCAWYNFKGTDQNKRVGDLSGGERNRLQLAKCLRQGGNVLMLDEPTNDLDVDTLRALEQALAHFAGTSLVISHDRWFLDRLATHILAFEGDSKVVLFPGSYTEYAADLEQREGSLDPSRVKYRPMPVLN